jgi:hypothetical protein
MILSIQINTIRFEEVKNMAATESVLRSGVNVKLNAGITPSGGIATRSVSLGKITDAADATKIMDVVDALSPVLSLAPVRVERTKVTLIEAE